MSNWRNKITDLLESGKITFSFEVTPDIPKSKIDTLPVEPVFFCVTWHSKSYDFKDIDIPPVKLAAYLRSTGRTVCLHLSCDLLKKDYLNELLRYLQDCGICNLFVCFGENHDYKNSDFKMTKELIAYIRQQSGDYFCIGVAGFPNCSDEGLLHLKQKIEIGANFIISQAIFEPHIYNNYLERCVKVGITVPVIPGIFVYETKSQLINVCNVCKVKVPAEVRDSEKSGVECVTALAQSLAESSSKHLHLFTLNKLDVVSNIVQEINKNLR